MLYPSNVFQAEGTVRVILALPLLNARTVSTCPTDIAALNPKVALAVRVA